MLSSLPLESTRERALLMRSMPVFAGVDDDSLALVAAHARTRVFGAGAVLAREHTPIDDIFAVVRGRVTVTRDGREVRLAEPASSLVGLLCALARDPRGFHVVADVETVVLEVPTQVVLDVLEEHFVMLRQLLRLASRALMDRLRPLGTRAAILAESMSDVPTVGVIPVTATPSVVRVELLLRLRELPMFARVDLDAMFAILRHLSPSSHAPGEVLWREGDHIRRTVFLEAGTVRCESAGGDAIEVEGPGLFGRLEAMAGEPARYTLTAVTPLTAQRMDIGGLLTVMESHFVLALNTLAMVARALIELPDGAAQLAREHAR